MTPRVTSLGRSGPGWIQDLALAPDGALWAVLDRAAVLRSTDGGETWVDVPSPSTRWLTSLTVTPEGAVLVGDEKGALHETRDGGETWVHTTLSGLYTLWSVLVTPDATLVGIGGDVARRRHGESGWTLAKKGPGFFIVRRLSRTDDGALFAACADMLRDRAAWRSRDGGDIWRRVLEEVSTEIVDLHAWGDRAYALLESGALLASSDGGDTWQRRPVPFTARGARIWSAGRVVYAFDGKAANGVDEGVGEVWRSANDGETWTSLGALRFAAGPVAANALGDLVVGGSVDDRSAIARWRDLEVADAFAARAVAQTSVSVAVEATASRPRGPEEDLLLRLLDAWRAKRHPALAAQVVALGQRCAPTPPSITHATWMALAEARRPEDLSALAATWLDGRTLNETSLRFAALGRFDDDPRVARALASFVCDFALGTGTSKPLWTAVGEKLVALRDPHTAVVVGAAAQREIPVGGAAMKAWLARYLPKLSSDLEDACAEAPPLDAADRALCAEAERLLRSGRA
jgi:photosystem II stability/assembly factor-like uncharacterized protein